MTWWTLALPEATSSSRTFTGKGRSASRSPCRCPISCPFTRNSLPPNRCALSSTPGHPATSLPMISPKPAISTSRSPKFVSRLNKRVLPAAWLSSAGRTPPSTWRDYPARRRLRRRAKGRVWACTEVRGLLAVSGQDEQQRGDRRHRDGGRDQDGARGAGDVDVVLAGDDKDVGGDGERGAEEGCGGPEGVHV